MLGRLWSVLVWFWRHELLLVAQANKHRGFTVEEGEMLSLATGTIVQMMVHVITIAIVKLVERESPWDWEREEMSVQGRVIITTLLDWIGWKVEGLGLGDWEAQEGLAYVKPERTKRHGKTIIFKRPRLKW